jgi:hypothetical protein
MIKMMRFQRENMRKLTSFISHISTPSLNKTNARKLPLPGAKRTLRIGLRRVLNDLINHKKEIFAFSIKLSLTYSV